MKKEIEAVVRAVTNPGSGSVSNTVDAETAQKIVTAVNAGKAISVETVSAVISAADMEKPDKKADAVKITQLLEQEKGTVAQYLDLSQRILAKVTTGGAAEYLGDLNETGQEIPITITVPTDLRKEGRRFYVIRVHNGVAERISEKLQVGEDGTFVIKSDKFSTYALVYEDAAQDSDSSSGGSHSSGSSSGKTEQPAAVAQAVSTKKKSAVKKTEESKEAEADIIEENKDKEESKETEETKEQEQQPEEEPTETPAETPAETEKGGSSWWLYVILVLAVAAAVGMVFVQKKRKELEK